MNVVQIRSKNTYSLCQNTTYVFASFIFFTTLAFISGFAQSSKVLVFYSESLKSP